MDVTMPQLGETVTEGTITRWLKQVGDRVEADEPLFEVSTDKVDSEVPAPVGRRGHRDPGARRRDRRGRRPPRGVGRRRAFGAARRSRRRPDARPTEPAAGGRSDRRPLRARAAPAAPDGRRDARDRRRRLSPAPASCAEPPAAPEPAGAGE